MKTTIAIMMYYMECGGVENALINLLASLDPQQYKVDLFFLEQRGDFLKRIPEYVTQRVLPLNELERNLVLKRSVREMLSLGFKRKQYFRALRMAAEYTVRKLTGSCAPAYQTALRRLKSESYDIALDFHGYLSLTTVFLADKIRAKKKYTWIHCEHFISDAPKMEPYFQKYDKILCVSEKCRSMMCEALPQYNAEQIQVMYNLLQMEDIQEKAAKGQRLSAKDDMITLLSVGRLSVQKGFDIALETAKILKDRGICFHWTICGEGEERQMLEQHIVQLGLQEQISMLGFCDNPYGYMESCDIYVQPSRYEGYAVTVTEAVALGCVVVSTDVSGAAEEIDQDKNGIITPIDATALADAIETLARNPQKLQQMRCYARNREQINRGAQMLSQLLEMDEE